MTKRSLVSIISAAVIACAALSFTACDGEPEHVHRWTEKSSTATCGESGETLYECECGETETRPAPATGKHEYSDNVCSVCGHIDFSGTTADAALEKYGFYVKDNDADDIYSTGDTVYFGSYPQNKVVDPVTLAALSSYAFDANEWTSYGYFSSGDIVDYAFYRDVTSGGKKYRGVYFSSYRPSYGGLEATAENSYIDDEGYATDTVYWFEYAPVEWNVLDYKNGSLSINAAYSLDAQPFNASYERGESGVTVPGTDKYINDWRSSSLREFLNGEFCDTAFDVKQSALIQTVTLDNGTTGYAAAAEYQKDQADTRDRVFLLSYADVTNADYGYTSKGSSRARSFTDYAVVQGLRTSSEATTEDGKPSCAYLLRSASDKSYGICNVSKGGSVSSKTSEFDFGASVDGLAMSNDGGILPAVSIRVGKAAVGGWTDFPFEYGDGEEETAVCSVYVPAAYVGGAELPLITYIGDSSYANASLAKYKASECTSQWITDDKMSRSPAFFLIICGSPSAALVNSVIDRIAEDYTIDNDRLYLTGQSMGGITDFALNDAFPDKFAATVYVDCQPGGEVHDETYDAIIERAEFVDQKFVYIASRKDELASQGQDDVEAVLVDRGITYCKLYDLDHTDAVALDAAIKAELDKGSDKNFFGFKQLTKNGNTAAEHMASFQYGYSVNAIFDWLLAQHK